MYTLYYYVYIVYNVDRVARVDRVNSIITGYNVNAFLVSLHKITEN